MTVVPLRPELEAVSLEIKRGGDCYGVVHEAGDSFEVRAGHVHRIVKLLAPECWTLIIPQCSERKSGFYRWEDGKALRRFWDESEFRAVAAHDMAA